MSAVLSSPPTFPKTAEVVPLRRPWRWTSGVLVLAAVGVVLWSAATNEQFQWHVVLRYFATDAVLRGLWLTLWLTAVTVVLGFVIGGVLAVMRLSGNPVLVGVSWGYVWLFRSVPLLVQLLFWFNFGALYPALSGATPVIGPLTSVVIGLVLHEAAYAAEVVRGGILSVDAGQREAAAALGLGRGRVLWRIVLPQAMRSIVPGAGNLLIGTLKGTSIVSVLAVQDLLYSVQLIYNRNYLIIPLLLVATLWYVIVTSLLGVGQHYVERYYGRGTR